MNNKQKDILIFSISTLTEIIGGLIERPKDCEGYESVCYTKCKNAWICARLKAIDERIYKL